MKNKRCIHFSILIIITVFHFSCNKILNEKPDKSLGTPNSINSLQNLLDFSTTMNKQSPSWDEGVSDNLFVPENILMQYGKEKKSAYVWNIFDYDGSYSDWGLLYKTIYVSNVVIEGIHKITPTDQQKNAWDNVLGSALFFRAQSFLHGSFIFCNSYNSATSKSDLGLVLRLNPDFNIPSKRNNLEETYSQIIEDLTNSIKLLPLRPVSNFRPSKGAAFALLARTYLAMRNYDNCLKYSDSCLQINNKLLDYNSLDLSQLIQFPYDNPEVIFYRCVTAYDFASASPRTVLVDTLLYNSYDPNDLRKSAFFYKKGDEYSFKGTYASNFSGIFTGIATDEVYFMRAECFSRKGDIVSAMTDLNTVLSKRWRNGSFVPFTANNKKEAIKLILKERRKELIFRCLRWMDIKRLNLEGANIILKRILDGNEYILEPNSKRYALPLPTDLVTLYGIPQNIY